MSTLRMWPRSHLQKALGLPITTKASAGTGQERMVGEMITGQISFWQMKAPESQVV